VCVTKMCAFDGCIKAYAQNEGRKNESKWMITCYGTEGSGFLYSIVTDGESWVHHVEPEIKSPLSILTYTSPTKRKFQDSNFCW